MAAEFQTDAKLAADSVFIRALPLCDVRLMREARWFWLLLVPRAAGAEELFDLSEALGAQLTREINGAARALKQAAEPCDKINIGALGNIVRQLHIHLIARHKGDDAWPGPVWGHGAWQELQNRHLTARLDALAPLLAAEFGA